MKSRREMSGILGLRSLLAIVLSITFAVTYIPATAAAEELSYRFKYADSENTTLTGYVGTLPEVLEIPASVTTIAASAFANNQNIKQVNATPRLTRIEGRAFDSCRSLESIVFPRIQYIGSHAFDRCYKLNSLSLGNELQTIGDHAFTYCGNLKGVALPSTLEVIESGAFSYCESLETITIPDSLTQIGGYAFGYSGLKKAYLGNGLTNLPNGLFSSCKSLEEVHIGTTVQTIGERTFGACSALESISIPDSVSHLDLHAFDGSGLTSVILPENVYVGTEAFNNCTELKYMYIPATVRGITYGLIGVHNLQRVLFGGSVDEWDQLGLTSLENKGVQVVFNAERPDPKPPQITLQPTSQSVGTGHYATFSITATASNAFTGDPVQILYQWQTTGQSGTWQDISASDVNYAGSSTRQLDVLNLSAAMDGSRYRCIVTNAEDRTKSTVSAVATLRLVAPTPSPTARPSASERPTPTPEPSPTIGPTTSTAPVPSIIPAPTVPAVPGYESGCMSGKFYYVKTAGASTMYYLKNSTGRMVRVSAPYTTSSTGTRYYPVNYGGAMLFPRIVDGRISCYCIYADSLEIPVLNVVSAASPTLAGEYQTGMMNGHMYFVKTSGPWTMYYLMSSSGRMARVSAPYVTDMSGRRCYPINHGGTVLFPKLTDSVLTSYATGSGETVLAIL